MNILYVAHESRMGGANLSLLGMLEEMRKKHQVVVAVPIREGFLVEELMRRRIPYVYQHSFWWMLEPAGNSFATFCKKTAYRVLGLLNYVSAWKLKKTVRQYNVDIIHSNSSVVSTGAILSRMTGKPHVWHIREFGDDDFHFFYVYPRQYIYRFINRNSNKVIAISKAVAKKFESLIDRDKLEVVYNGVSSENIYEKQAKDYDHEQVSFLISGRISREKGQDQVLRAAELLVRKGIREFHVNIAGPGDTRALEMLAKQLGIEEYVTYLGMRTDLPAVRRDMDAELVCSRCEAFGRVTVEAMMSSNPVIGSNRGGTKELIQDGKNGFLYEYDDIDSLAECMEKIIVNRELTRMLGREAYQSSANRFTTVRNADGIEKIYQSLLCETGIER